MEGFDAWNNLHLYSAEEESGMPGTFFTVKYFKRGTAILPLGRGFFTV